MIEFGKQHSLVHFMSFETSFFYIAQVQGGGGGGGYGGGGGGGGYGGGGGGGGYGK
jgi:hypothetical protein